VPDLHRSIGWNHFLLSQLRKRTGERVGADAARRAAQAVFLQIGDQDGLTAVQDTAATR
jgi:hypothetical protein